MGENLVDFLGDRASKLRKKGEAVYDKKYEGKKGSRRELYGDDQSDEEMSEEELEGEASAFPPSDEEEQDDDDEEDDEEEEAPALVVKPKKSSSRKASTTTTEQDEKAMMKQLKQAASADVEKGRDVKKQLVSCTRRRPRSDPTDLLRQSARVAHQGAEGSDGNQRSASGTYRTGESTG